MNNTPLSEQTFREKFAELVNKGVPLDDPAMIKLFESRYRNEANQKNNTNGVESIEQAYNNLINKGYAINSPEVMRLFRQRALAKQRINEDVLSSKKVSRNKKAVIEEDFKCHIVIDHKGNYYLLDCYLDIVDEKHINPLIKKITKKRDLKNFKNQVKIDFKRYQNMCKSKNIDIDSNIKTIFHKLNFFLFICPDADYQILSLIRENITKINSSYKNYFTACLEYLEALVFPEDKNMMPIDINYSCKSYFDDLVMGNHEKIANVFEKSNNPVERYKKIVTNHSLYRKFCKANNIKGYTQNNDSVHVLSKEVSLTDIPSPARKRFCSTDIPYTNYYRAQTPNYTFSHPLNQNLKRATNVGDFLDR